MAALTLPSSSSSSLALSLSSLCAVGSLNHGAFVPNVSPSRTCYNGRVVCFFFPSHSVFWFFLRCVWFVFVVILRCVWFVFVVVVVLTFCVWWCNADNSWGFAVFLSFLDFRSQLLFCFTCFGRGFDILPGEGSASSVGY